MPHTVCPRSFAARDTVPVPGHCWHMPLHDTLKHSKAGLAQSLWGLWVLVDARRFSEPSTSLRVYLWDFWALHFISLVYLFILSLIFHCPDYYKLYWLLPLYSKPWSFVVPVFPLCFPTPILCQLFCLCLYMYTLELIYQYSQSHLVKLLFGSHWNCSLTLEEPMHWQIEVLHGRCLIYAAHLVLPSIL